MAKSVDWTDLEPRVARVEAGLSAPTDAAQAESADRLAELLADVKPQARASIRALAVRGGLALARQLHRTARQSRAAQVLRDTLAIAGDLDPTTRIELLLQLAEIERFSVDLGSAFSRIHEALAIARVFAHSVDEARALYLLAGAIKDIGLREAADRHLERALALLDERDDPRLRGNIWAMRYPNAFELATTDLAFAEEAYRQCLACAAACPARFRDSMVAMAHLNRATTALHFGRVDEARDLLARAAACANVGANVRWLVLVLGAATDVRERDDDASRERLEACFGPAHSPSRNYAVETRIILADLYATMGQPARAGACLRAVSAAKTEALWSLLRAAESEGPAGERKASLVERLALVSELREDVSGRHGLRSARLAIALAERAGFSGERLAHFESAVRLHDIGKFLIPDSIVRKPGVLDPVERELMHEHAALGADILAFGRGTLPDAEMSAAIARHHHERWDGTGYPEGLAGEATPVEARIVAITNVFDALLHPRPWRPAMSREDALRHILDGRGTVFDPALVDHFEALAAQAGGDWDGFIARLERVEDDSAIARDLSQFDRALGLAP